MCSARGWRRYRTIGMRLATVSNKLYNRDEALIEIKETPEFSRWLSKLKDKVALAKISVRMYRIASTGNLGDARQVGDGVSELRIDYGPGYRLYFTQRGERVLLLLAGGTKTRQIADIGKAKQLKAKYEQRDW